MHNYIRLPAFLFLVVSAGIATDAAAQAAVFMPVKNFVGATPTQYGPSRIGSVAKIGDLSGDGVPEVALCSFNYNVNTGIVEVFDGFNGAIRGTVNRSGPVNVASFPDMNGDNIPDFLVGAPWTSTGGSRNGVLDLLSGSNLSSQRVRSGGFDAYLGTTTNRIQDISGDGVPDIISNANHDGGSLRGVIYRINGATGAVIGSDSGLVGTYFGNAIVGSDLNSDGVQDYTATRGYNSPGPGYFRVYSGQSGTVLWEKSSSEIYFGSANNFITDFTGDGIPEIVALSTTSVTAFSGVSGAQIYQAPFPPGFTWAQEPTGVYDCTAAFGSPTFAIGFWRHQVAGSEDGAVVFLDATNGTVKQVLVGAIPGAGFGGCVLATEDWTGDGKPDLAVSSVNFTVQSQVKARLDIFDVQAGPTSPIAGVLVSTVGTPTEIASHCLSGLPAGGQVLFGGVTSTGPSPFTYTLTGSTWAQQFPTFSPTSRTDASLLLDSARANNVLFGGRNPVGAPLADTWTWANNQWNFVSTSTAPSARSGHKMAFDRVRNVGILFGGKDATNSPLSDTWAWNGTTWTQLNPATSPPPRFDHGVAYDTLRDRIVMFGGQDATGLRRDTWEWDGTSWSEVATSPAGAVSWTPSPRARHTMAYDRLAERVVVHGGDSAAGCQSDVWSWDGTVWTLHLPETNPMPPARSRSQMIADASTGGLLLFGGACGTTFFNDAWTFELPVFSRFASYGAGCAGTLGIPTLSVASGSKPVLGQTFTLEIGNIPATPFNFPFGVFDLQRTTFAGLPIPVDLGFAGLPGCQAWTGAYWSYTLSPATSSNTVNWAVSLPTNPVFLGNFLYMQGAILDNFGGRFASLTNGIEARMGNR